MCVEGGVRAVSLAIFLINRLCQTRSAVSCFFFVCVSIISNRSLLSNILSSQQLSLSVIAAVIVTAEAVKRHRKTSPRASI